MIQKATKQDHHILAALAVQLWDELTAAELEAEFSETLQDERSAFFIKYVHGVAIGFAQCGLRTDYVEGTESSPVGYLEGIFVEADHRKQGYGKELVAECQMWAKNMGCAEFASDCELDNLESLKFHLALGFEEANRIICFRKSI